MTAGVLFKSGLGIFLQKFPLLLNYVLLDPAAFGFSEFLGTTFGDLVALVVCFGALGCYGCLGLLGCGSPWHPEKRARPWRCGSCVLWSCASLCIALLGVPGAANPGKRRGIGIRREELTRH